MIKCTFELYMIIDESDMRICKLKPRVYGVDTVDGNKLTTEIDPDVLDVVKSVLASHSKTSSLADYQISNTAKTRLTNFLRKKGFIK